MWVQNVLMLFPTLDLLPFPFPACFLFVPKTPEANGGGEVDWSFKAGWG